MLSDNCRVYIKLLATHGGCPSQDGLAIILATAATVAV